MLLLVGAVFFIVFNPGLQILLLKLLVNCIKLLCILLVGDKTLLLCIRFYRLFLFRSNLDTPVLLTFLHLLERVTFLLVDPGKSFFQFLFGQLLSFFNSVLHHGDAGGFQLLLCLYTCVGKFVLVVAGGFAGIRLLVFINTGSFKLFRSFDKFLVIYRRIGFSILFRRFLDHLLILDACLPYGFRSGLVLFLR